jgi:hypothetical protein
LEIHGLVDYLRLKEGSKDRFFRLERIGTYWNSIQRPKKVSCSVSCKVSRDAFKRLSSTGDLKGFDPLPIKMAIDGDKYG